MATKKTTEATVEETVATNEAVNPWEVKEEIFVPVISGELPYLYVSLNHYSAQIPRGQRVLIPKPVADLIRDRDTMAMENMKWAQEEQAKATQAMTPDGGMIRL